MEITFLKRLQMAWNAFNSRDPTKSKRQDLGPATTARPDRPRMRYGNEKSIVSAIYNRISLDVSGVLFLHARTDENKKYVETINSGLNNCLTFETNIDQSAKAFIQDVVMSMLDEGVVGLAPIDTSESLTRTNSFDILTMRTARIIEWYPRHVRVSAYNDTSGYKEEIEFPKTAIAIIENPFYATMNTPNSVLKRLIQKLNLLDAVDEQSSSGKLDLIIQLPYLIRTAARRLLAEKRRKDIEEQLSGSKYGIAYTDGTEKITQLNRASENNLLAQVEYLTHMLYSQLGITEQVLDGTADETVMLNYFERTVYPIAAAICDAMSRTFLTKTARTQGQAILYFRDPFKFVTATALGDLADKLTRNEILSSNEFRAVIGYKPSKSKGADDLRNKNLNPVSTQKENADVQQ